MAALACCPNHWVLMVRFKYFHRSLISSFLISGALEMWATQTSPWEPDYVVGAVAGVALQGKHTFLLIYYKT